MSGRLVRLGHSNSLRQEALDALTELEEEGLRAEETMRSRQRRQDELMAVRLERLSHASSRPRKESTDSLPSQARVSTIASASYADSIKAQDSEGTEDSLPERRASAAMRRFGSLMRGQMTSFKTTFKAGLTIFLVVSIFQGLLQLAWHWLNASVLAHISGLMRAYWMVAPPMAWYMTMIVVFSMLLVQVRNLPEDALLRMLRQLLGLESADGRSTAEGDILADFQDVASGLQDGLDSYDRMRSQMESTVASLGKFAAVGRRLAENINANRQTELSDAEKREQAVASVAEVMFELVAQMRDDTPGAAEMAPSEYFAPGSEQGKKAEMVKEVSKLVRELKYWSEGDARLALGDGDDASEGGERGEGGGGGGGRGGGGGGADGGGSGGGGGDGGGGCGGGGGGQETAAKPALGHRRSKSSPLGGQVAERLVLVDTDRQAAERRSISREGERRSLSAASRDGERRNLSTERRSLAREAPPRLMLTESQTLARQRSESQSSRPSTRQILSSTRHASLSADATALVEGDEEDEEADDETGGQPPPPRELPSDWRMASDMEGRTYFYHRASRVSQWHAPPSSQRPSSPPPSPPPPPPGSPPPRSHAPDCRWESGNIAWPSQQRPFIADSHAWWEPPV